MSDIKEWHKIGNKLTAYLGICQCQRKLKSIIDNLWSIHEKIVHAEQYSSEALEELPARFTGAEWALIAIMDAKGNLGIVHGINCEYPILLDNHEFWQWLKEVRNSPDLEDN